MWCPHAEKTSLRVLRVRGHGPDLPCYLYVCQGLGDLQGALPCFQLDELGVQQEATRAPTDDRSGYETSRSRTAVCHKQSRPHSAPGDPRVGCLDMSSTSAWLSSTSHLGVAPGPHASRECDGSVAAKRVVRILSLKNSTRPNRFREHTLCHELPGCPIWHVARYSGTTDRKARTL